MQRKVLALVPVVLLSAILSFSSYAPAVHAQSIRASHVSAASMLGQTTPNNQVGPATLFGVHCNAKVFFVYELSDKTVHCWYPQGYSSTYITNVLGFGATVASWVRMYNPAGTFFNLAPGVPYAFAPDKFLLTQICLGCGYHS